MNASPQPSDSSSGLVLIYVTCPDLEQATQIGRSLVEHRLAACTNILDGMTSQYLWEGQFQQSTEAVLIIKTTQAKLQQVHDAVKDMHPYDVPCLLAWPVDAIHQPYGDWLKDTLSS